MHEAALGALLAFGGDTGGWRQFSCDPFALCVVLQIISATATTGNNNNNLHPFCRLRFNFTGADQYIITQSRTSHNYGYLSFTGAVVDVECQMKLKKMRRRGISPEKDRIEFQRIN